MSSDTTPDTTHDDVVIRVRNISKYFEIYEKPSHRLWQMLYRGRKQFYRPFWALSDISFEVKRGECMGIIGRNGAGKSTLLQIITGTLNPSSGSVEIKGRVAALLELGSGFNPEFTGRENVYMNAAILGLSDSEIRAKYDDIVAFADIGEFIDQPVKSYSSGMTVRLAFAVVAHVDADVLIVDEALSVGDAFFTQKCMRFLRRFMEDHTVLFVSHDTGAVNNLCNAAVLLEKGAIKFTGSPKMVTEKYLEDMYASMQGETSLPEATTPKSLLPVPQDYRDMRQDLFNASTLRNDIEVMAFDPKGEAFGKGGATIEHVALTDTDGAPLLWVVGGEVVRLRVLCRAHQNLTSPIVGFFVRDRLGQDLFGDNTWLNYRLSPLSVPSGQFFQTTYTFRMPILAPGDYTVTVAIAEGTQHEHVQHQWRHEALVFVSHSTSCCTGLMGVPMLEVDLQCVAATATSALTVQP